MKERTMYETGKNGPGKPEEKSGVMALLEAVEEHSEHLVGVLSKKPGLVSCTLKDRLDGDKVYFVVVSAFTGTLGNVCYMCKVHDVDKPTERVDEKIPVPTYQVIEALGDDNTKPSLSAVYAHWEAELKKVRNNLAKQTLTKQTDNTEKETQK